MKYFLSAIIAIVLTSCMTQGKIAKICATCPVVTKVVTVKSDSSWQGKPEVKYDTTYVSIPGPTVVIPGPCDKFCDGNGKLKSFYQKSTHNGITQTLSSDTTNNTLVQTSNADSVMNVNKTITIQNNRLIREITKLKQTIQPKCELEHRNWLDRLARRWLWISLAALSVFGLWKFGPKLFKLFL